MDIFWEVKWLYVTFKYKLMEMCVSILKYMDNH